MNRSDGPNNDTDDIGNLHWRSITRQSHTVKDAGGSFIATDTVTGKRYLVNWSSFDAALAQDALRRLATLSAVKGPTA